jgi:hypothetical protein
MFQPRGLHRRYTPGFRFYGGGFLLVRLAAHSAEPLVDGVARDAVRPAGVRLQRDLESATCFHVAADGVRFVASYLFVHGLWFG